MSASFVASAVPSGNPTTSFTITIPSGTQTNDLCVFAATNRDATTDPSVTDNDTGGNTWAKLGGGSTGLTVWWKRATSGTASKTLTASSFTGSSSGVLLVWRGCSLAATPYANVTTESNASGNETQAGFTPTRDGSVILLAVSNRTNDLAVTSPSSVTYGALGSGNEKLSTGGSDCGTNFFSTNISDGVTTDTGNFTWAQTDAASISCSFELLRAPSALTAASGSFALTGQAAGLRAQRKLTAEQATFALTGQAALLSHGYPMVAASGSFALTGYDAILRAQRLLSAAPGGFALTGVDAGLRAQRKLTAEVAAFAFTGYDAGLNYGAGGGGGPVIMDSTTARLVRTNTIRTRGR